MDSNRKNNVSKLYNLSMQSWQSLIMIPLLSLVASCSSQPPATGLIDNHLRPCPQSPNCVVSEPAAAKNIEPLPVKGSLPQSWAQLKTVIEKMGGTIEEDSEHYLWATFTSKVFRFVDDVELRLDPQNNCIQVRSASRIGYSDLGVNRQRIDKLRALYLEADQKGK